MAVGETAWEAAVRIVAGVLLFGATLAAVGIFATRAGQAADGRVDPDAPIRTGRFDSDALLASMAYDPPAVQPSARRLIDQAMSLPPPEVRMALRETAQALSEPAGNPVDDAAAQVREFMVRIGPKEEDRRRGRWFVFVAGSGDAFGLNLIREGDRKIRRAGWSVEKLAEFGKAQVGVGYRKGIRQVSLTASRREIGAYGLSQEDTVVGVSVSVKP